MKTEFNGTIIDSKTLEFPDNIRGIVPCLGCRKEVRLKDKKDILCKVNNQIYGLCPDCEINLKEKIEREVRSTLKR